MKKTTLVAIILATLAPVAQVWGAHSAHYGKMSVTASGSGTVYLSTQESGATSGDTTYTWNCNKNSSADSATRYCYAVPSSGWKFTGWSGYATSSDNPYKLTLSATATSSGSPTTASMTATFVQLLPVTVTFAAPANGGYSVNGEAVNAQLVKANQAPPYSATLVATPTENFRFAGWYMLKNGVKSFFSTDVSTTRQFEEDATVGAEFIPDGFAVYAAVAAKGYDNLATALSEAQSGESISVYSSTTLDTTAAVGVGVSLTVVSGVTLTVASGATLYIDGSVSVNGMISGMVSKCTKLITMSSNNGKAFEPYVGVKYLKSQATTPTISGVTSSDSHLTIKNELGATLRTPLATTTKAIVCDVDMSVAVNNITSIAGSFTSFTAAYESARQSATSGSGTSQSIHGNSKLIVMLANDTSASVSGDQRYGFMVDCAGCNLGFSATLKSNYDVVILNSPAAQLKSMVTNTRTHFFNCTTATIKINSKNSTIVNCYDCGDLSISYDPTTVVSGEVNIYSGGPYSASFNKLWHIYGGTFQDKPSDTYLWDSTNYEVQPDGSNWKVVEKKKTAYVAYTLTGTTTNKYEALSEAISEVANGETVYLMQDIELDADLVIDAGREITIEMTGCDISGHRIVNAGVLHLEDRKTTSNPGTISSGIVNNSGTITIAYGEYTGSIELNGGMFTVYNGTVDGSITVASSVDDPAIVANLKGGQFASRSFSHGSETKDISTICEAAEAEHVVRAKNGRFRVARFPAAVVTDTGAMSLSAVALDQTDSALWTRFASAPTRANFTAAEWYRACELQSTLDFYQTQGIDCAILVDRQVSAGTLSVSAPVVGTQPVDADILVSEFGCSVLLPMIRDYPHTPQYAPWAYSTFLPGGEHSSVSFGLTNENSANNGTLLIVQMRLASDIQSSSGKKDYSYTQYDVIGSRKYVLNAGTNKAMIRPATGAATFYSTLGAAMSAVADGGTVMLANDCDTAFPLTKAGTYTFDTMGFAHSSEVSLGAGLRILSQETVDSCAKVLVPNAVATTYVVGSSAVAMVGETPYETLAAAVAAANGAVVTLVADTEESVTLASGQTLKLKIENSATFGGVVSGDSTCYVDALTANGVTTYSLKSIVAVHAPTGDVTGLAPSGETAPTESEVNAAVEALAGNTAVSAVDSGIASINAALSGDGKIRDVAICPLSVTLKTVGNVKIVTAASFDVTPRDANGNVVSPLPEGKALTFRLPIDANASAVAARGFHGDEVLGVFQIQTADGEKYIEISASSFSAYGYELLEITADMITVADAVYDGTAQEPAVTVVDGTTTLTPGTDYTVSYSNNNAPGTGTVTVTGAGDYAGSSATKNFTIGSPVAKIGSGNYYATLPAAVAAAQSGDTITLLADATDSLVAIPSTVTFVPGAYDYTAYVGAGTAADPYLIGNLSTFKAFRDAVNAGDNYDGKSFKLTANIDLSSEANWTPIGDAGAHAFKGIFDGDGKTISHLTITGTGAYKALFGYVGGGTTEIGNVNLSYANVNGEKRIAGLAAEVVGNARFYNCSIDENSAITGTDANIAGLIAEIQPPANSTITCEKLNNYATVSSTGSAGGVRRVAGVCCQTTNGGTVTVNVTFTDCHNYGAVTSADYAGGIMCAAQGANSAETFDNCSNSGMLTGAYTGDLNAYLTGTKHEIVITNYSGNITTALSTLQHGAQENVYFVTVEGTLYAYKCVKNASTVTFGSLYAGATLINKQLLDDFRDFAAFLIEEEPLHRKDNVKGLSGTSTDKEIFYNAMVNEVKGDLVVDGDATASDYRNTAWVLGNYNTANGTSFEMAYFKPGWTSDTLYKVGSDFTVTFLLRDEVGDMTISYDSSIYTMYTQDGVERSGAAVYNYMTQTVADGDSATEPANAPSYWYHSNKTFPVGNNTGIPFTLEQSQAYVFDGWRLSGTSERYDFTTPVTADITLVPHFSAVEAVFEIYTEADLLAFAREVNLGRSYRQNTASYMRQTVKLMNDITLTSNWTPVAGNFHGIFDGNNHSISGLVISDTNSETGFFRNSGHGGVGFEVKDLTFQNPQVTSTGSYVGVLVGQADSVTITNVKVNNPIVLCTSTDNVGGLVGSVNNNVNNIPAAASTFSGCSVNGGTISCTGSDGRMVGGLIGQGLRYLTVTDCSVSSVTISGYRKLGGLIGQANDAYLTCTDASVSGVTINALGTTSYAKDLTMGGFVGLFATPKQSTFTGTVGDVTMTGPESIASGKNYVMGWVSGGTGGTVEAAETAMSGASMTFDVIVSGTNTRTVPNDSTYAGINGTIPVAQIGDTIYGTFAEAIAAAEEYNTANGSYPSITVLDATAALDNDDWKIDNGYLVHKVYVAQIVHNGTTTKYDNLQSAIDAAQSGDTITLLTDVTIEGNAGVTVAAGQNVVLDLDGHTVQMAVASADERWLIKNEGTLTVKDSGEGGKLYMNVTGQSSAAIRKSVVKNMGSLTVESGTIELAYSGTNKEEPAAILNDASNRAASLTIKGGTIVNDSNRGYGVYLAVNDTNATSFDLQGGRVEGYGAAVRYYFDDRTLTDAKLTFSMSGGTIYGRGLYGVFGMTNSSKDWNGISFDISGGTVGCAGLLNKKSVLSPLQGSVSISGGTFNGDVYIYGHELEITDGNFAGGVTLYRVKESLESASISGGQFSSGLTIAETTSESTANPYYTSQLIRGGYFANEVPESLCAEGCIPSTETTTIGGVAYYTVKQGAYVARNTTTGTKYETLFSAVAAATAGDTVALLADVEESLTIRKSLALTGDYTITGTTKVTAGAAVTVEGLTFDANGLIYALDIAGGASVAATNVTFGGGQWCNVHVNGGSLTGSGVTMLGDEVVVAADGLTYTYRGATLDATDAPFGMNLENVKGETVTIPFMDIVRENGTETVSLADADGAPLVQGASLLFVANMPGISETNGVALPARFGCYTLTIDASIDFLGDGETPTTGWTQGGWNEIIDTGSLVLEAIGEDSESVPVLLALNGDTDLGETVFTNKYANLTVDGRGNTLSGTVKYAGDAGVVSNAVLGTAQAPLYIDLTGDGKMAALGDGIVVENVVLLLDASKATAGTVVFSWDADGEMPSIGEGGNLAVVIVDAQGNPTGDEVALAFDLDAGIAYIGPCEARLTGPTHETPIYSSLYGAISQAAQEGDTITLLTNVMESLTIRKSLALTGDYTIPGTTKVTDGATVSMSGVTFDADGMIYALDIAGGASVAATNVTFGGGQWCNVHVNGGSLTGAGVTMRGDEVAVAADGLTYTYRGETLEASEAPFDMDLSKVKGETVTLPFMDIVRENGTETVSLADADGAPLVQAGSILYVANMPGIGTLDGVTLPARFASYTLTLGVNIGFLGDGETPTTGWTEGDWNEIIDTGAKVLEAVGEDSGEVSVKLALNGDTDLGTNAFVFSYGNLTIDGNGNEVSGTIIYTEEASGMISNVVLTGSTIFDVSAENASSINFGDNVTIKDGEAVTLVIGELTAGQVVARHVDGLSLENVVLKTRDGEGALVDATIPEGLALVVTANGDLVVRSISYLDAILWTGAVSPAEGDPKLGVQEVSVQQRWTDNALRIHRTADEGDDLRPINETDDDLRISWSTSDSAIATIDADGLLTFHDLGTVTVTITVTDGFGNARSNTSAVTYRLWPENLRITGLDCVNRLLWYDFGTEEQMVAFMPAAAEGGKIVRTVYCTILTATELTAAEWTAVNNSFEWEKNDEGSVGWRSFGPIDTSAPRRFWRLVVTLNQLAAGETVSFGAQAAGN